MNQLLVELDGVEELKKTYVVCATSRPDLIDKAIIRSGWIDQHIFFDIPSEIDRRKFLVKIFGEKSLDLDEMVKMTKGFSFSDLEVI